MMVMALDEGVAGCEPEYMGCGKAIALTDKRAAALQAGQTAIRGADYQLRRRLTLQLRFHRMQAGFDLGLFVLRIIELHTEPEYIADGGAIADSALDFGHGTVVRLDDQEHILANGERMPRQDGGSMAIEVHHHLAEVPVVALGEVDFFIAADQYIEIDSIETGGLTAFLRAGHGALPR
jgi:hypothetical protein